MYLRHHCSASICNFPDAFLLLAAAMGAGAVDTTGTTSLLIVVEFIYTSYLQRPQASACQHRVVLQQACCM